MALKRFEIKGYGQLELNQAPFRRSGRIEAQCKIADGIEYIENGMLLAVNRKTRTVGYPTGDANEVIALNYTTEHMYDERTTGLKNFKLDKGTFYPRMGYLSVGDKFTTNCLCFDTAEFADEAAVKAAYENVKNVALYGGVSECGAIKLSATKPVEGPVLLAVLGTGAGSMPDGQFGIKFQVVAM
jgi:hypothetical protein